MVKTRAVRIDSVVTSHTIRAKGCGVRLRKFLIDLRVTFGASDLVKGLCIAVAMAILAFKQRAVHAQTMFV